MATSAPSSIGEHTIGRAASQRLIKLPDGSGLYLTTTRYLTPAGTPLHEKGLEPTVAVDQPEVEFGQLPPASDPVLEKALEKVSGAEREKGCLTRPRAVTAGPVVAMCNSAVADGLLY